jgi:hypothetical protein
MAAAGADLAFLGNKDEAKYLSTVLKLSVETTKKCLADGKQLVEIDFPFRKSDPGAAETLDLSIDFASKFIDSFRSYGQGLWFLLPDKREAISYRKRVLGNGTPSFTLGAIDVFPKDSSPSLIVVVNPGFNVDEWINIPKILEQTSSSAPVVIINGNLARLRNGYYPAIFYPGLDRVSKSFYSRATQAMCLAPISVAGSRQACWSVRIYPSPWSIVVRSPTSATSFEVVHTADKENNPQTTWKLAKEAYAQRYGGSIF